MRRTAIDSTSILIVHKIDSYKIDFIALPIKTGNTLKIVHSRGLQLGSELCLGSGPSLRIGLWLVLNASNKRACRQYDAGG
jgi:hypothetical protein